MTVAATPRKAGPYTGNGVTTLFPFSFKVFSAADVQVVYTDSLTGTATTLVLNSDYSVLLNPDQDANPGGTITYPLFVGPTPELPATATLTVIGGLPYSQPTDITNTGRFLPQVIENALDRAEIQIQQLAEVVSRTLQAAVGTTVSLLFPPPSSGKFIRWRTDLLGLENAEAGTDSMVLQGLLADAADPTHGVAFVAGAPRVVDSIAALRLLPKTGSKQALLTGYYTAGDGGGGFYRYDSTDTTSLDNGGTTIVGADNGRWKLTQTVPPSIKQFGAKADWNGVTGTDNTASINAALADGDARVTPGSYYAAGTVVCPPTSGLHGDSAHDCVLISGVAGATPAFSCTGVYGVTGQIFSEVLSDIYIKGSGAKVGTGVNLTQLSYMRIRSVTVQNFNIALNATDCINIRHDQCAYINSNRGVLAVRTAFSYPNAWSFDDCIVNGNSENGMTFTKPATLMINGGSFEGNGVGGVGPSTDRFAVYINANPAEGGTGLVCRGAYFEGNSGDADIIIDCNDGDSATHLIDGNTFNRISSVNFTTNNVRVKKPGAGRTTVRVTANGFRGFNTYVPNAARRYIDVPAPVDSNWHIDASNGNYFASATEVPAFGGTQGSEKASAAAWVRFNGSTGAILSGASHNVASITRHGVGDYTATFSKALSTAGACYAYSINAGGFVYTDSETASSVRLKTFNTSSVATDFSAIGVAVFGPDS